MSSAGDLYVFAAASALRRSRTRRQKPISHVSLEWRLGLCLLVVTNFTYSQWPEEAVINWAVCLWQTKRLNDPTEPGQTTPAAERAECSVYPLVRRAVTEVSLTECSVYPLVRRAITVISLTECSVYPLVRRAITVISLTECSVYPLVRRAITVISLSECSVYPLVRRAITVISLTECSVYPLVRRAVTVISLAECSVYPLVRRAITVISLIEYSVYPLVRRAVTVISLTECSVYPRVRRTITAINLTECTVYPLVRGANTVTRSPTCHKWLAKHRYNIIQSTASMKNPTGQFIHQQFMNDSSNYDTIRIFRSVNQYQSGENHNKFLTSQQFPSLLIRHP